MDQWTPEEVEAHIQYMHDFADQARGHRRVRRRPGPVARRHVGPLRRRGAGRRSTDGPFAETKDLIAGWMIIDVDSYERAIELAGELSAAPGAGGKPIHEWLEVRPVPARAAHRHRTDRGRRRARASSSPGC